MPPYTKSLLSSMMISLLSKLVVREIVTSGSMTCL